MLLILQLSFLGIRATAAVLVPGTKPVAEQPAPAPSIPPPPPLGIIDTTGAEVIDFAAVRSSRAA